MLVHAKLAEQARTDASSRMTTQYVGGDEHFQSPSCRLLSLNRCDQTKNQCIVREKARPRRARRAGNLQLEDATKLDDSPLSSTASASPSADKPPKNGEFSLDLPNTVYHDPAKDAEALEDHHKRVFKDDRSRSPMSSKELLHLPPKYISSRKLTLSQATHLLNSYLPKLSFFPFVTLPANPTIPTLSQQSPFLLLAILTTAAIPHPYLHHQLDQEFRRVLSLKLIVETQKSLDYLLGLLVYIAWYPVHTKPKSNPCFTYINLANSLALDLGLNQAQLQTNPFREFDLKGLLDSHGSWTMDARRAYMGCYVLSSHLSKGFNKPQTMSYENLLPSNGDCFIPSHTSTPATAIVILERISDRINEAWTSKNYPQMDVFSTELYVQLFTAELDTWKRNLPDSITASSILALYHKYIHLSVYAHALRLLRRPYRPFVPGTTETRPSLDHLQTCLRLSVSYLQHLLSLPTQDYTHFNIIHWSQLVHCLVALVRLTFVIAHVENWSSETTRERVGLSMYLEALCFRLGSLSLNSQLSAGIEIESNESEKSDTSSNQGKKNRFDRYFMMRSILSTLKKAWEHRVEAIVPKASAISKGKCPMFDPEMAQLFESTNLDFDFGDLEECDYSMIEGMGEWDTSIREVGTDSAFTDASGETPRDGEAGLPWMTSAGGTVGGVEMPPGGVDQHASGGTKFSDLWTTMTCSWAEQPSSSLMQVEQEKASIGDSEAVVGYQVNK
ncbi:hypothetical protein SBOR_3796 [Sclerotinia borealis F-4128]|uniref:Transcription factor domain-containing protein n=1 Tax=Sclerotinia borealis (strain F-4128) TaxID=1432307 RepID=W9CM96_SCLBF|nr:hypothetical protein SBOR_3796 [Sclerotinia borealis F-4128]